VEVGPGRALSRLAQRAFENGAAPPAAPPIVTSMRDQGDPQSDAATLMSALGRLWTTGVIADWDQVHAPDRPRRMALPTYPFERRRHWIEPAIEFTEQTRPARSTEVPDGLVSDCPPREGDSARGGPEGRARQGEASRNAASAGGRSHTDPVQAS